MDASGPSADVTRCVPRMPETGKDLMGTMQDIKTLVRLDDLQKLYFYRDYYMMLIDMVERRDKDATALKAELRQLIERIEELESPSE
jgi:hypothetical protein